MKCKTWKSVCYHVFENWHDIRSDYSHKNHGFYPQVDAFANKTNKRFPTFSEDAWSGDWSEPLCINHPFGVFPHVVKKVKQSGAKVIRMIPNCPK